MRRVCVFCGSSPGARPEYVQAAKRLGHTLAGRKIGLVYGGARGGGVGKMGGGGGRTGGEGIGGVNRGVGGMGGGFVGVSHPRGGGSVHERKAVVGEPSGGFIAMPGGFGTLEEFFEVLTQGQLGMHRKPCGLLNVCRYYDKLIDFLGNATGQQFIEAVHRDMMLVDEDPETLLEKFESYRPPTASKAAWALQMTNSAG